jgi:hypothetical protein
MITYKEEVLVKRKIFIKQNIVLNSISTLFSGLEYNVIDTINNSGNYGFTFNNGINIIGKCNKERFLKEYKDMFIFL